MYPRVSSHFIASEARSLARSLARSNPLDGRRRISLPDLLSVIERCLGHLLRHPSTKSPTCQYLSDIPLSGVRKSCRRWFLQVFSPSRSIGTPEPVSKKGLCRLDSMRWAWGGAGTGGANGLRSAGRHFVLHRHEFVSLRSCRPPFSHFVFLSPLCSRRSSSPPPLAGLFFSFPLSSCVPGRSSSQAEKQPAEPSHQVKIHHVRPIPRATASRHTPNIKSDPFRSTCHRFNDFPFCRFSCAGDF